MTTWLRRLQIKKYAPRLLGLTFAAVFGLTCTIAGQAARQSPPQVSAAGADTPALRAARGIYLTKAVAGADTLLTERVSAVKGKVNALVIDVKDVDGIVAFENKIPAADEAGVSSNYISNIDGLLAGLKEQGFYTIARICVFKDDSIANARPDYALRLKNGGIYRESGGGGTWLNPYNRDVWSYTVDIAKGAAAAGFDEIQFDYIRFPTDRNADNADFGDTGGLNAVEIINEFARYVTTELRPLDTRTERPLRLSADIFGTVITSAVDRDLLGQDVTVLAGIFDILCPMIYPSHYAPNTLGVEHPDLQPYAIVYAALRELSKRLSELPENARRPVVRPWLQDFTASWLKVNFQQYGGEQVSEQINACRDAGVSEWLLWSPANLYHLDYVKPPVKKTRGKPITDFLAS
ncbi:MAG: putative glycoside hydrolase [Clostridiales bacterium]|nr:putative glycoside hydrolase [Clostridiales bacterium]